MKWLMVWNSITSNPKWLALPIELRGAWITLICYASTFEPERWRFRDRQHAALLLRRDGVPDAEDVIEALIKAGWLDELQDGGLETHDHADWQRYPSDMPDQSAHRKRLSRSRAVTSGHKPVTQIGEKKVGEKKVGHNTHPTSKRTRSESPNPNVVKAAATVDVLSSLKENGLSPELAMSFEARRRIR